jgi:7-cyano-7-deazaguanine synthase
MLSVALGWAEVLGASDLFCGVNAVDYSGYPDCRPEFIAAFEALANLATKAGVEGAAHPRARAAAADVQGRHRARGLRLGVDFAQTVSCYQADADGRACGHCDACRLRADGFAAAGVDDPTRTDDDRWDWRAWHCGRIRVRMRSEQRASLPVGR